MLTVAATHEVIRQKEIAADRKRRAEGDSTLTNFTVVAVSSSNGRRYLTDADTAILSIEIATGWEPEKIHKLLRKKSLLRGVTSYYRRPYVGEVTELRKRELIA
jgi:hypothetical protein